MDPTYMKRKKYYGTLPLISPLMLEINLLSTSSRNVLIALFCALLQHGNIKIFYTSVREMQNCVSVLIVIIKDILGGITNNLNLGLV